MGTDRRGKKRGEKMYEELVKLREDVKIAKSNIPVHLSHLTDNFTMHSY